MSAPEQTDRLGHYRLLEKIGAGGMGEVFLARDEHLDREVAVKLLPPSTFADTNARKRFRKEAMALSKISHPNVATVFDFDTQADIDFLVMEYVPGMSIAEKLMAGPLPEHEVLLLGIQVAEGLASAHVRGVIHRDLKPGNVRVTAEGRAKILDFGLAKLRRSESNVTATVTETGPVAGTLPYMPPEQLQGKAPDPRNDI